MRKSSILSVPFIVWMLLFTIVPLGIVVWFALTDGAGHFTFSNIAELFAYDPARGETLLADTHLTTLLYSLHLGFWSTLICLVVAYPMAYAISRNSERSQKTLILLVMLPMWMNFLLRTKAIERLLAPSGLINTVFGWMGLGPFELLNNDGAIIFGLVYDFLPYMILPLYSVMVKIRQSEVEAAQDLGANAFSVFARVILPLSLPGILNGITMVFVPSVSTFVISTLLGGGKRMMIGDVIESLFVGQSPNMAVGSALSLLLMILMLICITCTRLVDKGEGTDQGGMAI